MILHASSQHGSQVGQSHSVSPAELRGWAAPQRVCIGLSNGTARSRLWTACRWPASGTHTKGRRSEYGTALNSNDNCITSYPLGRRKTVSHEGTFRTRMVVTAGHLPCHKARTRRVAAPWAGRRRWTAACPERSR